MREVALRLLSDNLSREQIIKMDQRDIECKNKIHSRIVNLFSNQILVLVFLNNTCYIIQREIDLVQNEELNFFALAKNGLLGKHISSVNLTNAYL